MTQSFVSIRAGASALAHIQQNGLTADDIGLLMGASGGRNGLYYKVLMNGYSGNSSPVKSSLLIPLALQPALGVLHR